MHGRKHIPSSTIKALNVIIVAIPFAYVWFHSYQMQTVTMGLLQSTVLLFLLYIVVFCRMASRLDGFRVSTSRIGEMAFGQIAAAGVADACVAVCIWAMSERFPNLWPGLICFAVQCLIIVPTALFTHIYFINHHKPCPTVVICHRRQGIEKLISAYGFEKQFDVQGVYDIGDVAAAPACICDAQVVFLCGIDSHERNGMLKQFISRNQKVYLIPGVSDTIMSGAERMHLFHLPLLRAQRYNPSTEYRFIKRAFDIAASAIALIVLSPLFLIVALAVRSDGGPVLYRQTRLTKDGKAFEILKFRSMCVDAEKMSGAVLSTGEHDERVTKVGRVIRACRLDELPQLINIFTGDMSIVGPRPERPEIAAEYEKQLPEFALRLQAKAGLTGYAQVYGRYNTTPYDKLLMDLMYVAKPSVYEDLAIILATMRILFIKDSTQGIAQGQTTAAKDADKAV